MGSANQWMTAAEARGLPVHRWRPGRLPPGEPPVDISGLKGVPNDLATGGLPVGRRLAQALVIVAGLGAVGGEVLSGLARLGVGQLLGVDPGRYGPDSHLTQPIRRREDVDRPKAVVQGERAFAVNPQATLTTVQGFVQDLPLDALRSASLLISAGDNAALPLWLGRVATGLGIPMIQGAVCGEQWLALARGYGPGDAGAACPSCNRDPQPAGAAESGGCDPQRMAASGPRTVTLAAVCSMAAQLVVGEALKWLLGIEPGRLCGEESAYCLLTHRAWRTRYVRNPRCVHARWRVIDVPGRPERVTLAALARSARVGAAGSRLLQVRGELPFASYTFCDRCGRQAPVRRFVRAGAAIGKCRCGGSLVALPQGLRSVIPQEDLRRCRGKPLGELGIRPGDAIGLSWEEEWSYFFVGKEDAAGPSVAASLSAAPLACEKGGRG